MTPELEEIERLKAHALRAEAKIKELHLECQKYRVALNRVAYPTSWGVKPGFHVDIAIRALVIGENPDPIPTGAHLTKEEVQP